jgi:hypothetical protein
VVKVELPLIILYFILCRGDFLSGTEFDDETLGSLRRHIIISFPLCVEP